MVRLIHRRADQVVHRRIQDQEIAPLARFHIDHLGHQLARVARDQAARLDLKLTAEVAKGLLDHLPVFHRQGRCGVGPLVRNAKAAAQVQAADVVALSAQGFRKLGHLLIGQPERLQVGQLRADVDVDPHHLQPRQRGGTGIDFLSAGDRDAELVLGFAGGNLGVGLGIHIRIDPDGDRSLGAQLLSHGADHFHLRFGFHVELADAAAQRQADFLFRLADAGEDDPVPRHARCLGTQVFALADHIHPRTGLRKGLEDRLVRGRFHRKTDQVISALKCFVEQPEMAQQGGGGIDIERSAHRRGDLGDGNVFGEKRAVAVEKMVHSPAFRAKGADGSNDSAPGPRPAAAGSARPPRSALQMPPAPVTPGAASVPLRACGGF